MGFTLFSISVVSRIRKRLLFQHEYDNKYAKVLIIFLIILPGSVKSHFLRADEKSSLDFVCFNLRFIPKYIIRYFFSNSSKTRRKNWTKCRRLESKINFAKRHNNFKISIRNCMESINKFENYALTN